MEAVRYHDHRFSPRPAVVGRCGADRNGASGQWHIFRRVHRIYQKIEQCLLQLHRVAERCRQIRRSISSLCRSRKVELMSSFISIGSCLTSPFSSCREDDESLHRHARLPRLRSGSCSRRQSAQRAPGAIAWTCQVRFDPSSFVRRRGTVSIASVFRPKEAVTTLRKCVGAMRLRRVNVCEPCSWGGYWTTVQST
jgi:hypothetical protein